MVPHLAHNQKVLVQVQPPLLKGRVDGKLRNYRAYVNSLALGEAIVYVVIKLEGELRLRWLLITVILIVGGVLMTSTQPQPIQAAVGVPKAFSYQGRLYDSSSNLLGGTGTNYCFKFSIWDNSTVGSGSRLWPTSAPTGQSVSVRYGVFNFDVGTGTDALTYNFA